MLPLRPPDCSAVLDPQCVQLVDKDESHPFGPPLPDIPAAIGGNVLEEMAKAFQAAVGWFVSNTASWWVKAPSPDLQKEPAVGLIHQLTQPITIAVAMTALLIVAGKMVLTHKANPLIDAGGGLVVLATVTTIGALLPTLLLQWGDEWSSWALQATSQGDFAKRMRQIVTLPTGVPAGVVVIMSLAALFIGIIQAILLLFRQAALIILAGVLPLAAAGMITTATRPWFKKVTGWGLALIFYKAAASAVYATAFLLVGNGKDLQAVLMGFAMMLISLIAFPVLLKFFDWTTSGAQSGNGSGGVLGAVLGGATALGALRSFGGGGGGGASPDPGGGRDASASQHADFLNQQLGQEGRGGAPSAPPADGSAPSPSTAEQGTTGTSQGLTPSPGGDHGTPSGSGGEQDGEALADGGGSGEPVGPATIRTWNTERRRGSDAIRWLNDPSGSGEADGGPTGATGEGGGGGSGA